jgi:hypothetical protein
MDGGTQAAVEVVEREDLHLDQRRGSVDGDAGIHAGIRTASGPVIAADAGAREQGDEA